MSKKAALKSKAATATTAVSREDSRERLAVAIQKHAGLLAQKKALEERKEGFYDRLSELDAEIDKARKALSKSEERELERIIDPKLRAPKISVARAREVIADLERESSLISTTLERIRGFEKDSGSSLDSQIAFAASSVKDAVANVIAASMEVQEFFEAFLTAHEQFKLMLASADRLRRLDAVPVAYKGRVSPILINTREIENGDDCPWVAASVSLRSDPNSPLPTVGTRP